MKPIRVFNRTAHKAMWTWLANNPYNKKEDWPGWDELGLSSKQIINIFDNYCSCFACITADHNINSKIPCTYEICKNCPLEWGEITCYSAGTLYNAYCMLRENINFPSTKHLALAIANLPLRGSDKFVTIVI